MGLVTTSWTLQGYLEEHPLRTTYTSTDWDGTGIHPDFVHTPTLMLEYRGSAELFEGPRISSADSVAGTLLSVTPAGLIDPPLTFSVLLPNLPDGARTERRVQVAGVRSVTTGARSGAGVPAGEELWSGAVNLHGTVRHSEGAPRPMAGHDAGGHGE